MYCGATKAPPKECPKCKRKLDAFARRCAMCAIDLDGPRVTGPDPRAVALARTEMFQAAEKHRRAGQLDTALALFDQVLIADPRFVPAWIARGKCFAAASEWLGARDSARSALAIDPSHAEAASLLQTWERAVETSGADASAAARHSKDVAQEANRRLEAGDTAGALELFDALTAAIKPDTRDDPNLSVLHNSRGLALQRLRRWPEALASFDEAVRVNARDALAWQNRASTLDDLGRLADAVKSVERSLDIDRTRANPWVDLGFYFHKLGNELGAREAYQEALARDPKHAVAWLNLGNVQAALGDRAAAVNAYRKALEASPTFEPARAALAALR
jgi:tetratricopeptide (TPR) repeat protein